MGNMNQTLRCTGRSTANPLRVTWNTIGAEYHRARLVKMIGGIGCQCGDHQLESQTTTDARNRPTVVIHRRVVAQAETL